MTTDLEDPQEVTDMEKAMPTYEDNRDSKVIIALLNDAKLAAAKREDKQDDTNEHLHECIHSIDENVKGIKAYFIGIDPASHIIHHVRIGETEQTMKDLKKAIYGSIASVIITAAVAWISWSNMQVQKDLQAQVAEVVKHQAAEKK